MYCAQIPVQVDVTDEVSVEAAAEVIRGHLGGAGLDGLVNNAGILVTPGMLACIPPKPQKLLARTLLGCLGGGEATHEASLGATTCCSRFRLTCTQAASYSI